jgi:hypothetical protein
MVVLSSVSQKHDFGCPCLLDGMDDGLNCLIDSLPHDTHFLEGRSPCLLWNGLVCDCQGLIWICYALLLDFGYGLSRLVSFSS